MKLNCIILIILSASCQTNTSTVKIVEDSAYVYVDSFDANKPLITKTKSNDSIYKVGDYLFEGNTDLIFDFFPNDHHPAEFKSKGDTLYSDGEYTILADDDKVSFGVYKKYQSKYRFEDFKVEKIYNESFTGPNFLTDRRALEFRTAIRRACLDTTINFAGHYTIAEWGCGMECDMMAVIDRINGRVFFSNKYLPFDTVDGHWGIDYRKDSRLIIVNSSLMQDHPGYMLIQTWRKVSYYEWKGNKFIELQ